jgi:hypothetical protein
MALMDPLDLVFMMMQVLMCQDLGIHLWYLKVLVLSTLRRREMQPEMVVLLMMVMGRDLGILTLVQDHGSHHLRPRLVSMPLGRIMQVEIMILRMSMVPDLCILTPRQDFGIHL